jgi:hypothetical protein
MDLGPGTYIKVDRAATAVRGGGFGAGDDTWLAYIVGPDPKFGFNRVFLRKDKSGLSGSKRSGSVYWSIDRAGVYEWHNFCVGSTSTNWQSSGFCVIDPEGNVTPIERDEVLELVDEMNRQVAALGDADRR